MRTGNPRPFAGETDLPGLGELISACQVVDRLESPPTLHEIREELFEPITDWAREPVIWEFGSELRAHSCLWIPPAAETQDVYFWFAVHPSARDGDLAREIVA